MEVFMSEWDFLWDECLSEKELIEAAKGRRGLIGPILRNRNVDWKKLKDAA